jgi:hypothetical protein
VVIEIKVKGDAPQHPLAVELAARLDDPGQHQLQHGGVR